MRASSVHQIFSDGLQIHIHTQNKELVEKYSTQWFLTDDIPDLTFDHEETVEAAKKGAFIYKFNWEKGTKGDNHTFKLFAPQHLLFVNL